MSVLTSGDVSSAGACRNADKPEVSTGKPTSDSDGSIMLWVVQHCGSSWEEIHTAC